MKPLQQKLNNHGYTLTEAMVVVAMVAIMSGFGYSGFSSWITKERVRSTANQLAGHLREARIRSIEKHTSHSLVYDSDIKEYKVFIDADGDLNCDEGEAEVLKVNVNPTVSKVLMKNPEDLAFSFDVRGFPLQQDSIVLLNRDVDPASVSCINNDCCRMLSAQNGLNCGSDLCCAVCVSYGDIQVVCNDDY